MNFVYPSRFFFYFLFFPRRKFDSRKSFVRELQLRKSERSQRKSQKLGRGKSPRSLFIPYLLPGHPVQQRIFYMADKLCGTHLQHRKKLRSLVWRNTYVEENERSVLFNCKRFQLVESVMRALFKI